MRRPEYEGVATYVFASEEPVPFSAGAYVHMRIPGVPEGEKAVREFSIASAPGDRELWFGIDTSSGSPYQAALERLAIGETVELFKIKTHFTWPPENEEVVMVAGGVGITPFRSQIIDRTNRKLPFTLSLVHAARGAHLYAEELAPLVNEYHETDRASLTETLVAVAYAHPRATYFIAGSEGFVASVAGILRAQGVTRIESDNFSGLGERF